MTSKAPPPGQKTKPKAVAQLVYLLSCSEPKPALKVSANEKAGLKLNIQKTKIMASGPITSWQIEGENVEAVTFYFPGLQNHCRW